MVRRMIRTKPKKLVRTTIPEELHSAIDCFRRKMMQNTGKYKNNADAGRFLASRINRMKPPKKTKNMRFML